MRSSETSSLWFRAVHWAQLAIFFLICLAMTAVVQRPVQAAGTSRKIALLIGNSQYAAAPRLRNPENDVHLLAHSLRAIGFKTTEGTNLTRTAMLAQVEDFSKAIRPGDVAIFYYAGHAVQANGTNFLLPVDNNVKGLARLEATAVNANDIIGMLASQREAVRIVILDACRNNPFSRSEIDGITDSRASREHGLAQIEAPRNSRGMVIAYSTAPGQVAFDGFGGNGPYARTLAREITQPGLTLTEVFQNVRQGVIGATKTPTMEPQVPWESSSLTENVVLVAGTQQPARGELAVREADTSPIFIFTPVEVNRTLDQGAGLRDASASNRRVPFERGRPAARPSISIMN
jgi:uncharacterized caspase-like protein